jgi:choline dehydrogenase-like flavoprotein
VDYRALSNPLDIDIIVEYIHFWRRYMRSSDFAPYSPRFLSPQEDLEGEPLRQWVRDSYIPSGYHPIGTASKKPKQLGGVVDEELFVHGTKKLRVVDASIMPMLPGANTQQTVYMIAEKVSI